MTVAAGIERLGFIPPFSPGPFIGRSGWRLYREGPLGQARGRRAVEAEPSHLVAADERGVRGDSVQLLVRDVDRADHAVVGLRLYRQRPEGWRTQLEPIRPA